MENQVKTTSVPQTSEMTQTLTVINSNNDSIGSSLNNKPPGGTAPKAKTITEQQQTQQSVHSSQDETPTTERNSDDGTSDPGNSSGCASTTPNSNNNNRSRSNSLNRLPAVPSSRPAAPLPRGPKTTTTNRSSSPMKTGDSSHSSTPERGSTSGSGGGGVITGTRSLSSSKSNQSKNQITRKLVIPRHPETTANAINTNKKTNKRITTTVAAESSSSFTIDQEQALFEQRLCEDAYGVAIRKINQYGKSNLRYVRCVTINGEEQDSTTGGRTGTGATTNSARSVGSWVHRRFTSGAAAGVGRNKKPHKALVWGSKKKDVQINLQFFTMVRKGKATDRARKNSAPASRILSLLSVDPKHPSLDIEAPTELDRDKFARAFARFLKVPLQEQISSNTTTSSNSDRGGSSSGHHPDVRKSSSSPAVGGNNNNTSSSNKSSSMASSSQDGASSLRDASSDPIKTKMNRQPEQQQREVTEEKKTQEGSFFPPPLPPRSNNHHHNNNDSARGSSNQSSTHREQTNRSMTSNNSSGIIPKQVPQGGPIVSVVPNSSSSKGKDNDDDNNSHVSSLTGHGYDQELVEEMHHALTELRTELEESRAEAARAVKVAEQAIQSAERSNSMEWQNTVTHKAAEAAALAQKRSASAMAKQRVAEERLDAEKRAAAFWRKQTSMVEEEAGALQTRAAAAEVQRAAVEEQLECERRSASEQIAVLKSRFTATDKSQRQALEAAMERNRALETELDATRRDLQNQVDNSENVGDVQKQQMSNRKNHRMFGRKKKQGDGGADSTSLLSGNTGSSSALMTTEADSSVAHVIGMESFTGEQILKVQAETQLMRQQFELLKRTTADHLDQNSEHARSWGDQVSQALQTSQSEVSRLREKLSMESASRRKLLHEVQDLRGTVRVYCRPHGPTGLISLPSHDTLLLHREKISDEVAPLSFEFDRVFEPQANQQDVYTELEDVCLGVLDGYRICMLTYGPTLCGKTLTLLGEVSRSDGRSTIGDHGIQLRAIHQLFTIAEHRSDRFKDTFSLTILEVSGNERIHDLLAATETGESRGQVVFAETKNGSRHKSQEDSSSLNGRPSKLEIRTDVHGDTVVQGLVAVEVDDYEDVKEIWEECLEAKARRLEEQCLDPRKYESSTHVIATLKVTSTNITTGIGSIGKIQFADLAGADVAPRQVTEESETNKLGYRSDFQFSNRSLETLSECVESRLQFDRSVPYRNSTLTHLLRDSLEADTKVIMIACISSDPKDIDETVATLRFASRMRRVSVGKATKHTF